MGGGGRELRDGSLAGTSTGSIGRKTSSFRSSYWGEWCLECCNGVCPPAASAEQCEGYIVEMQNVEVIAHRRSVVRLTYLAQDRRDIALSANTLARTLMHPKVREGMGMKRVIRYLRTLSRYRLNLFF